MSSLPVYWVMCKIIQENYSSISASKKRVQVHTQIWMFFSRRQMCYDLSDVPCLKLRFHSNVSVGCYMRRFVNKTMKERRDAGVVDLMIDLVASEKQLNKKLCPKLHPEFVVLFFRKGSFTRHDCDVERNLLRTRLHEGHTCWATVHGDHYVTGIFQGLG